MGSIGRKNNLCGHYGSLLSDYFCHHGFAALAQWMVHSAFQSMSRVPASMTGAQAARRILNDKDFRAFRSKCSRGSSQITMTPPTRCAVKVATSTLATRWRRSESRPTR